MTIHTNRTFQKQTKKKTSRIEKVKLKTVLVFFGGLNEYKCLHFLCVLHC